jgi:GH15 family glucan-1,4-alpha-glucosidase
LVEYVDQTTKLPLPSYELWEVRLETTTYTTAVTIAALTATAKLAKKFNEPDNATKWQRSATEMKRASAKFWNDSRHYFYRGFYRDGSPDDTIDLASFYGAWKFQAGDVATTQTAFQTYLQRFGIDPNDANAPVFAPRFENDDYNGFENPWFICGFWLAQYAMAHPEIAPPTFTEKILDFANDYINQHNILPEQFRRETGEMLSAAPLNWSTAEFLTTLLDYAKMTSGKREGGQ